MAVGVYTQQLLIDAVNAATHGKSAQSVVRQDQLNRAVRFVISDLDLRSTKRKETLSPNLFADVFDYTAPSNLKGRAIVDIKRQVKRSSNEKFSLVDEEEFDLDKGLGRDIFTMAEDDLVRQLRIDGGDSDKTEIHTCNSLTANGTWAVVAGTDATNLTLDTDTFVSGGASLNFDTNSGATTAAIENSTMAQKDLTKHDEISSIFVWVYIPATSGLTNFILRWGNDSTNYWSRTVTVNNEGNAFYVGWNLLRFDWNGATETGTVAPATIDYVRLTITKTAGMAADTDWRVDDIVSRIGDIYDVVYYSAFGWQSAAGAYKENSTATDDALNATTEEVELFVTKSAEYISQELKDYEDVKYFRDEYARLRAAYLYNYPSEAIRLVHHYYKIRKIRF